MKHDDSTHGSHGADPLREATERDIERHLRAIGPTNYQVDDVVICKVTGNGLQSGSVYPVYSVLRQRASNGGVETTVTVNVECKPVAVCPAVLKLATPSRVPNPRSKLA
jgi:hypothetical protein